MSRTITIASDAEAAEIGLKINFTTKQVSILGKMLLYMMGGQILKSDLPAYFSSSLTNLENLVAITVDAQDRAQYQERLDALNAFFSSSEDGFRLYLQMMTTTDKSTQIPNTGLTPQDIAFKAFWPDTFNNQQTSMSDLNLSANLVLDTGIIEATGNSTFNGNHFQLPVYCNVRLSELVTHAAQITDPVIKPNYEQKILIAETFFTSLVLALETYMNIFFETELELQA